MNADSEVANSDTKKAIDLWNKTSKYKNYFTFKILNGTIQVVAGLRYRLNLILYETDCSKKLVFNGDFLIDYDCELTGRKLKCRFDFVNAPWNPKPIRIFSSTCKRF